jgi:hypothetical protein
MGRNTLVRIGVGIAGSALLLLGIAGLLVPILPGWALIIGGLLVLGREFAWADRTVAPLRRFLEERGLTRRRGSTPSDLA